MVRNSKLAVLLTTVITGDNNVSPTNTIDCLIDRTALLMLIVATPIWTATVVLMQTFLYRVIRFYLALALSILLFRRLLRNCPPLSGGLFDLGQALVTGNLPKICVLDPSADSVHHTFAF